MFNVIIDDIMTEHPIRVREDLTIGQVAHLLLRYRINGIIVVDKNDKEKMIGIFTTTDLLKILEQDLGKGNQKIDEIRKSSAKLVGEEASRDVVTLQKTDKVSKALALMHRKNIHTIPVMDGDQLVGVIGRHDILNIAFS